MVTRQLTCIKASDERRGQGGPMTDHAFLAQHGLFDARAPRYTSYPPAPHFSEAVGPAKMETWLQALPADGAISLYLHIPFCRRLCWFCACRTQGIKNDAPLIPYMGALLEEIRSVAALVPPGSHVSAIHLGGGTPTILSPDMLGQLFAELRRRFAVDTDAEISVEVDPTVLDDACLDALALAGVTRASIGVQDFDDAVQSAIGRPQSFAQTHFAVSGLRARGIKAVNIDLLYGLPKQTQTSLSDTLDEALALEPDRVALFGYAHVPWASKRQVMIKDADLPDGPERLCLFDLASWRFRADGFVPIGIDHFARPEDPMAIALAEGTLRRSFQGYTVDAAPALIGLGASAISCLPQGYAQNAVRTADWQSRVRQGRLATGRGHALSDRDRLVAAMIEQILCYYRLDPARFGSDAGHVAEITSALAASWPEATTSSAAGVLLIVPRARPLARLIAMELDEYSVPAGRHSVVT